MPSRCGSVLQQKGQLSMEKQNPLQPFWYDSSRTETSALSLEPRDRRTRDENAGGTRFHTRVTAPTKTADAKAAAEALVRKRLCDQDETDHKRRFTGDSSLINSDILTSEDDFDHITSNRQLCKTSSRPSNASSESMYFFNKIPSSPPVYLSQHAELPSSPQRPGATEERETVLFTSQATMIPNTDYDSTDSDSTVDFNINTLNRVHGYISSDYLASEPTFGDQDDQESIILARARVAQSIEEGSPKVYLENMGLKTLPEDIEDLRNLVCWGRNGVEIPNIEIYATHNKLRILPPSLFNVSNLSVLSLRDNRLKKIPGKIFQLKKLTYLSVSNNEIKALPYQILQLPLLSNLLVRPNPNLVELKDQDELSYFCIGKESSNHDMDVRRFVSKIKWCVDLPLQASSQISPQADDRELAEKVSPVPKLSELALRKFCKYSVTFTEAQIWKKHVPVLTQRKITKALQKGIYDERCSVCDALTVNPIAKALEWWDFKTQRIVPVRRNFCCGNCVKRWLDDVEQTLDRLDNADQDLDEDLSIGNELPSEPAQADQLRFDEEF